MRFIKLSIFLSIFHCSFFKSASNGKVFIISDTCLYSENTQKSKCLTTLKANEDVELIAFNLPDKKSELKGKWYKVSSNGKVGFLFYDDQINKLNFASIIPVPKQQREVTASALRLRNSPSLKGDIIDSLPKGTIVSILGQSPFQVKIDEHWNSWAEIETSDGKRGFSFSAYLGLPGNDPNPNDSYNIIGFVEIKNPNPILYHADLSTKYKSDNQDFSSFDWKKHNLLYVDKSIEQNGFRYYHFQGNLSESAEYDGMDYGKHDFYISDRDSTFHIGEISENSQREVESKFPKGFTSSLRKFFPLINFKTLKLDQEVFISNSNVSLYSISYRNIPTYDLGYMIFDTVDQHNIVIQKNKNEYSILNSEGGTKEFKIINLNQDNDPEILETSYERMSESTSLYTLLNGQYQKIAKIENLGDVNEFILTAYSGTKESQMLKWNDYAKMEIRIPYLVFSRNEKEEIKFEIKDGRLIQSL